MSGKWQAARLPPSLTSSGGSSCRQISCAFQQRVWKRHAGGGLAGDLPMSRQAVSKHLHALSDAGLVMARREGRETRYTLTPAPLAEAIDWMTAVGAEWDERLERLRRSALSGRAPRPRHP